MQEPSCLSCQWTHSDSPREPLTRERLNRHSTDIFGMGISMKFFYNVDGRWMQSICFVRTISSAFFREQTQCCLALEHSIIQQSDCWRKAKQQPPSWQPNANLFANATNVNKLAAVTCYCYCCFFCFVFLELFGKYDAWPWLQSPCTKFSSTSFVRDIIKCVPDNSDRFKGGTMQFLGKKFNFIFFIDWFFMDKQTKSPNSLRFHDWINWINKLTLKDDTVSYGMTLFICGGPCLLSSIRLSSGDLIFLWEQLAYSVTEKMLVLLPH